MPLCQHEISWIKSYYANTKNHRNQVVKQNVTVIPTGGLDFRFNLPFAVQLPAYDGAFHAINLNLSGDSSRIQCLCLKPRKKPCSPFPHVFHFALFYATDSNSILSILDKVFGRIPLIVTYTTL